ncbi:MAG: glycosyltransferase [Geodermatophilaceae bacterium]|nr:glycosyltransferase [Geodermatophilaceae bacterium]
MTLYRLVAAFLLLKLINLGINLVAFPRLDHRRRRRDPGLVSLLVPARDEADHLARTLPAFLAQPVAEVILLDDGSSDETPQLARDIAAGDPRLHVLTGRPTPPGWTGKTWACHQLAAAATGSTLLFCDADVDLGPGAVDAVAWHRDRQDADVFSVFARQVTGSLAERMLAPVIDDVLLCFLPHPLLRAPAPAAATASGGLLAMSRTVYDRLGGFAAVRTELVEDVALARRTRRQGLRLGLALGGELVSTRMYRGYADAVVAFGRGVHGVVGPRRLLLVLIGGWHLLAYTVPLLLCRRRAWRWLLLAGALERLAVEAKTGRRQWADALLMPLTPPAMLPVLARAMHREQRWKGRVYR